MAPSHRSRGLYGIPGLLADLGDFERAEKVFEMLKDYKIEVASDLAVVYARNNDPSNAVRMLLHIPDDNKRAEGCIDVVRTLIDETWGKPKWPYKTNAWVQLYDYAMASASNAGGPTAPGND